MDDFGKPCQCSLQRIFKIIILFGLVFLIACSNKKEIAESSISNLYKPVEIKPFWLRGPDFVVSKDNEYNDEYHAFFDGIPFSDSKTFEVNTVLTTLEGSEYYYKLDLASGKTFRDKVLCEQSDVWNRFGGSIEKPPFTEGVVPRLLDQLGQPQKIIVFGDKDYLPDSDKFAKYSYRVRIVGGVLEQYCRYFPCGGSRDWLSRLVLIAVNPRDPKFAQVNTMSRLKERVSWKFVKAYLENYQGRSIRPDGEKPAFRHLGEIDAEAAFKFAFKNGYFFQLPQLRTLKKNCWAIYDFTWKGLQKVRENQSKKVKDIVKERDAKIASQMNELFLSNVVNEEVSELDLSIDELITIDFSIFFRYWYKKFGTAFNYCKRFVPSANHRVASERHWALEYFSLFMKLEELGYAYSCTKKAWVDNPKIRKGKRTIDLVDQKKNCTSWEFDSAFIAAEQFVDALALSDKDSIRYIEYDEGVGGTGHRLYSWIEGNGKENSCGEKIDKKIKAGRLNPFPSEVSWKAFEPGGDESLFYQAKPKVETKDEKKDK